MDTKITTTVTQTATATVSTTQSANPYLDNLNINNKQYSDPAYLCGQINASYCAVGDKQCVDYWNKICNGKAS